MSFHHHYRYRYRRFLTSFSNTSSRQLVQSILDQSHLSPFTTHIQPILAEYDHAMRLYPLPTCVRTYHIIIPPSLHAPPLVGTFVTRGLSRSSSRTNTIVTE